MAKTRKTFLFPIALFLIALLPRIFGLERFITSDENTNIFLAGSEVLLAFLRGDFKGTYWHFYPGVTMSWLDSLGLAGGWGWARLTGQTALPLADFLRGDILAVLVATRLPYALLSAAFVPALYYLLRRLLAPTTADDPLTRWPATVAALRVALDPFFLAHSRVVHGDAPVAVFMGLSALALLLYLRQNRRRWLVFSAGLGALAALTKAPGQLIAVLAVAVPAADWLWATLRRRQVDRALLRRRALDVVWWGGISLAVFALLWPAMWVDPLGTVRRMLEETVGKVDEGHLVFFMGRATTNPGLWFYPYVIWMRLTPVTAIGALLSVVGLIIPRRPSDDTLSRLKAVSAQLWLIALVLLIFGLASAKKQDRYLLPIFPLLDILAALGWYNALRMTIYNLRFTGDWAERRRHSVLIGGAALVFAFQAMPVFNWYPYYLAYFNPLAGGLARAVETTLVGWGEGLDQAAVYLNAKPNAERLFVASTPSQTFLPYFKGTGENFYTNDVALRADYVVIYRAQQQRLAPSAEIVKEYLRREPEKVITIKGVPYAWIYPNTPLIFHDVPPAATLTNIGFGGIMRLAGYAVAPTETGLTVDLFWHALPAIENDVGECREEQVESFTATVCPRHNYAVSVRLANAAGVTVAQHDGWPAGGLLPTSQWRVDDYVQDTHALSLPANLPPGNYTLAVVVYRADTGSVLAGPVNVAAVSLP